MPAKLLVSVRSSQEAAAALDGGADIIDIKEPSHGALGRASPDVIAQIAELVRVRSSGTIVSAALGEVVESTTSNSPVLRSEPRLDLVKSGLSGLVQDPWKQAWRLFRESCSIKPPNARWVAVSYADHERSRSPSPLDVLNEGRHIGCPILLIDTFEKDGTSLIDWLSEAELDRLRQVTRAAGMKLALAGQITVNLLPQILTADPDIVAVRGAVCEAGDRGATVTSERVRELATALRQRSAFPAAM